jgi:hypothetical protein
MVRTASVTAGAQRREAHGVSRSTGCASQRGACNLTSMSILCAASRAVMCLVRWVVLEVLPLPMSTRGSDVVGAACRLVGCGVSLGILSVELRASATLHGEALALLWAGSGLTAVLIGNIARELMFVLCSSVATWMGHAFHRDGVTLGGRTFLEIHYPAMTWVRCECGADEFSYEWTEPSGRCNRVDVQFHQSSGQHVEEPRAVIRMTTAPRMTSD